MAFGLSGLAAVRDLAGGFARRLGMGDDWIAGFVLAVNEVTTNAVTHGAETASVRVWDEDGHLVVQVHDDGAWRPSPAGQAAPGPFPTRGMGLWVARRMASVLDLDTGTAGTTVTMRFDRRAVPGQR
ncbi:ATP-binding protein [Spongiactinospora sp. TRM90649]|uniref:ATP-binding protein n=1 Tax=Spongiactinospora sp. TRM90649 TaxID=3031114 RepID=UPI0023F62EEA|nr:ATP-binding protein [Spongiactinospora sp. TRM90649]MDF5755767.1 ATP-binding protein [Spongiactinospora sp. TRM90649]